MFGTTPVANNRSNEAGAALIIELKQNWVISRVCKIFQDFSINNVRLEAYFGKDVILFSEVEGIGAAWLQTVRNNHLCRQHTEGGIPVGEVRTARAGRRPTLAP